MVEVGELLELLHQKPEETSYVVNVNSRHAGNSFAAATYPSTLGKVYEQLANQVNFQYRTILEPKKIGIEQNVHELKSSNG